VGAASGSIGDRNDAEGNREAVVVAATLTMAMAATMAEACNNQP